MNADGTVDPPSIQAPGSMTQCMPWMIQPDGKILRRGDFTSFNGATRRSASHG
ncbi:MAG: hypothetical protein IPG69_12510 [Flavobacteriales bacterium]|nr:hypothetical protein [Flavobacteriales bacterium]